MKNGNVAVSTGNIRIADAVDHLNDVEDIEVDDETGKAFKKDPSKMEAKIDKKGKLTLSRKK